MTWWVALSSGIGLLLALLFLGIPVFVAFLILNVAGILVLMGPAGFGLFANSIYTTATITALATVPLFIVMGEILFRSGAMEAVFDSLDRLVGRIRGRQYVLCILLSAVLGALSGAAMAVAGLLGRSLLPEMLRRGYNRRLSAGVILAGACLDPIIPPSVLAILIATLAEVSTAALLIAGIIPGLLLMCLFLIYVLYRVWRDPSLAPELSADLADGKSTTSIPVAVLRLIPCAFVFLMVMGLIMFGVATPTEAAATGVFGAIIVAVVYGKFSVRMIWDALIGAATVSALLLVIMCCAVMFSQLLTFTGATRAVAELVAQGACWPTAGVLAMRWYEVAKYLLRPSFGYTTYLFLMNLNAWNKLSDAERAVVTAEARKAEQFWYGEYDRLAREEEAELIKRGAQITEMGPTQKAKLPAAWAEAQWDLADKKSGQETKDLRALLKSKGLTN